MHPRLLTWLQRDDCQLDIRCLTRRQHWTTLDCLKCSGFLLGTVERGKNARWKTIEDALRVWQYHETQYVHSAGGQTVCRDWVHKHLQVLSVVPEKKFTSVTAIKKLYIDSINCAWEFLSPSGWAIAPPWRKQLEVHLPPPSKALWRRFSKFQVISKRASCQTLSVNDSLKMKIDRWFRSDTFSWHSTKRTFYFELLCETKVPSNHLWTVLV